jgi:hypothetical protein
MEPRRPVHPQDQFQPRRKVQVESPQRYRIEIGYRSLIESLNRLFRRTRGDQRGRLRCMQKAVWVEVIGIGVTGALSREHANAATGAGPLAGRLHDLLVNTQAHRGNRLEIQVGIIAARRQGLAQAAFQQPFRNAKFLKKIALVVGNRGRGWRGHRTYQFTLIHGTHASR